MDILHSLGEIRRNSGNFKQWEHQQRVDEAKREALAKQNPPSADELKHAKELGHTIIDVVDIMDQHSEDMSENVETVASGIMGFVPLLTAIGTGLGSIKFLLKPTHKAERAAEAAFYEKNNVDEKLAKWRDEHFKNGGKRAYSSMFLNERKINNLKLSDASKEEARGLAKELKKLRRPFYRKYGLGVAIPVVSTIAAFIFGNAYATKVQVDSSKIARYQARKILEDPKYFVNYTPEQIAQAKEILNSQDKKALKKKKLGRDKLKKGFFSSMFRLVKDRKAYKTWKANDRDDSKKVSRPLSAEELAQAKRDQEVIQRVVRKVNNNAEVYSENMETASNVIFATTPILGGLAGWLVSAVANKTGLFDKYVDKKVEKLGNAEAKTAYKELKDMPKKSPFRNAKFMEFFEHMMNSVHVEGKASLTEKLSKTAKIKTTMEHAFTATMATGKGRNMLLGLGSGFLAGFAGLILGLKMQKASARAGRFVAKEELEKDPHNFIGYTPEELKNAPKGKVKEAKSGFWQTCTALPTIVKQYFRYNHYKKHAQRQDNLLKEELIKMDVSAEQMRDAKNLQRKIFNTFEKVDDKSQTYSESMEMAVETAQPFVKYGMYATILAPVGIFVARLAKGKITGNTIIKNVVGALNKMTNLANKKPAKKYFGEIAASLPAKIKNVYVEEGAVQKVFQGMGLKEMVLSGKNMGDVVDKMIPAVEKLSEKELQDFVYKMRNMKFAGMNHCFDRVNPYHYNFDKNVVIEALENYKNYMGTSEIPGQSILASLRDRSSTLQVSEMLHKFGGDLKNMSDSEFVALKKQLEDYLGRTKYSEHFDFAKMDKAYIQNLLPKVDNIISNVPKEDIAKIVEVFIEELEKNPEKTMAYLTSGKVLNMFNTNSFKIALGVVGGSYVALNFVIKYAIESWLANMQLKAGRLGVMKALDELKDPTYYANVEPTNN